MAQTQTEPAWTRQMTEISVAVTKDKLALLVAQAYQGVQAMKRKENG